MIRKVLLLAALSLVTAAGAACLPSRIGGGCEKEEDCPSVDGGKLVCYNLHCVECHYDGDCPSGSVCSGQNTCQSLHKPEKEEEPAAPATSLEECAKRCKGNAGCGDACRDQFKKK